MRLAPTLVALVLATTPVLAAPTAKHRATAAQEVYDATVVRRKAGQVTVEAVYQWSVRWLEAELDGASAKARKRGFAAHLARMTELETDAANGRDAGTVPASEAAAATYFRIEAEIWHARGKR